MGNMSSQPGMGFSQSFNQPMSVGMNGMTRPNYGGGFGQSFNQMAGWPPFQAYQPQPIYPRVPGSDSGGGMTPPYHAPGMDSTVYPRVPGSDSVQSQQPSPYPRTPGSDSLPAATGWPPPQQPVATGWPPPADPSVGTNGMTRPNYGFAPYPWSMAGNGFMRPNYGGGFAPNYGGGIRTPSMNSWAV